MRRLLVVVGLCFLSLTAAGVRPTEASTCWDDCYSQYENCSLDCGGRCPECAGQYSFCLEGCP